MQKIVLKALLVPFVAIYGCFIMVAGIILPIIPLIAIVSALSLLASPILWVFRKAGFNLNIPDPYFKVTKRDNDIIGHILTATLCVWIVPFIVYIFVRYNIIFGSKQIEVPFDL